MINPEKSFNIHDYIEIFLRRIWYIIIPFVIVLAEPLSTRYIPPRNTVPPL